MCWTSAQLSAVQISANSASRSIPLDAVKSQLDQFVGREAAVDFRQHRRRQAFLADGDDGIQMMRGGAQGAALGGQLGIVSVMVRIVT